MADLNRGRRENPRQEGPRSGGHAGRAARADARGTSRAAVPWYVGTDFKDAPPGHRYLLYLPFWKADWSTIKEGKQTVLKDLGRIPAHSADAMRAIASRQYEVGKAIGAEVVEAVSTSPFATGLGWEHPNENGFAFLNPYGLPYLAGSGVKGVLRNAAIALVTAPDGESSGWTKPAIDALFGPEDVNKPGDALRGMLRFFDVIPDVAGDHMAVDIMNPHYGEYYQGKSTPHDAGTPIPVFFLVVPPGSKFTFVVDCLSENKLPEHVRNKWREMIRAAFAHAFDWLGFGAKTAVGYGAMEALTPEQVAKRNAAAKATTLNCPWVDGKIVKIAKRTNSKVGDVLRGRQLAEAWAALNEPDLKQHALADIRARWEKDGWWTNPPGPAAKKAKAIYDGAA